ncbi:MAG: hypothetical protein FWG63_03240 [Defluviitaleaceae bacterium]|nr:hypothetical protein [Defluviitaleaceae bacterium]
MNKKKKAVIALAAIALMGTIGATTAYAANNSLGDIWTARSQARGNVSEEQREQRWELRNDLFSQLFAGNIIAPSDETIAERQATRLGLAEQFYGDGLISQELFDIVVSSLEAGRAEFNADERMANRNALWEQISRDGISAGLIDAMIAARESSERQGGSRGGWFRQQ